MAIYHMHVKVISRAAGRSATAAAAYRAGKEVSDERTGEIFDYTRKRGVSYSEIMTPASAPEWMKDRQKLWNAVEQVEKRKDAQVAREVEVALPVELTPEQKLSLIRSYVRDQFVSKGMVADVSIHDIKGKNPHAHVLLTMRDISGDGFGGKNRSWNDKALLEHWREQWSVYANKALERAGSDARIDHRTLEAQGISRAPTQHLGPTATEIEKKGVKSRRREWIEVLQASEILERVSKHNSVQQLNSDAASIRDELKLLNSERAYHNVGIIAHKIEAMKAKRNEAMLDIEIAANEWKAIQRQHKFRAALHNLGVFTDKRLDKLKNDELQAKKIIDDIDKRMPKLEAQLNSERSDAQLFIEEQKRIERERRLEQERIERERKIQELLRLEKSAPNIQVAATYMYERIELESQAVKDDWLKRGATEERATAESSLHWAQLQKQWFEDNKRKLEAYKRGQQLAAEWAEATRKALREREEREQGKKAPEVSQAPQVRQETPQQQAERVQHEVQREVMSESLRRPTRRQQSGPELEL